MNLRTYLENKGYEFKKDRTTVCPFCEHEGNSFVVIEPEKEVYFCHICNAKGNIITLKKHFNDNSGDSDLKSFREIVGRKDYIKPPKDKAEEYHKLLMENQEAFDYLLKRGLKLETIKYFQLGYMKDKSESWITIPYYESGSLINIKFRSLHGKKFKNVKDAKLALFHQDCLKDKKEVLICEGEFDAMMCWQSGIKNVISVSGGAGTFRPEWVDQMEGMEKIYIWYDNDEPGQKGLEMVSERLGIDRCWIIKEEEVKDANEYFMVCDSYDLGRAKQIPISNVVNFWDSVFKIFEHERDLSSEIKTPWGNVDKLLGTIEGGDLITLSAVPKTGKSTMALNIATYNAKRGYPVLVYCLEMRPERLAKKVIEAEGFLNKERFTRDAALNIAETLMDTPLYFGYNYKNITTDIVFQTIRAAVRRYGLKLVIFDNLHFLIRSLAHVSAEVGNVTRGFKMLAEELRIPLILIAQPRKVEDGTVMTINDLKDSSSIGADSDQVIILWRKKTKSNINNLNGQESSFEPKTLVRVDASRYTAGGDTVLWFAGEYSKFTELDRGGY
jgi:twinkle protein